MMNPKSLARIKFLKHLVPVIVFLFIVSHSCYGQYDHLKPIDDFNSYSGDVKNYFTGIFKLLQSNLSDTPIIRYIVTPSFNPEYTLSIEKDKGDSYQMVFNLCSENYWYAKSKGKVKIKTFRKPIDKNLAFAVRQLFLKVTTEVKKPDRAINGDDGVDYYFFATDSDHEIIAGQIWSPEKGSKMRELVEACEDLVSFVLDKGKSEEELIEETNRLISNLE